MQDHQHAGDAGLYDLLLHARDRAYTVPQLAELVSSAGLGITAFIEPARYDPATYVRDPRLMAAMQPLSPVERAAAAEVLAGNLRKHVVYITAAQRAADCTASPDDTSLIPTIRRHPPDALAKALGAGHLSVDLEGYPARFPAKPRAPAVVRRINGKISIAEILASLRAADPALTLEAAAKIFAETYAPLNGLNLLHLKSRNR